MANNKKAIVREALKRFPDLSTLTLAKYIIHEYGDLFDNDLSKARDLVRYHRGLKNGSNGKTPDPVQSNPQMPKTWRKKRSNYQLSPGLWFIINDVHVPFHEPVPIESAIKSAQTEKPDGILINGDFQDCAGVSFWPQTRKRDFDKEIEATIDMIDFIQREVPVKEIVYKPGNHEYRLPRQYYARVPDLIGMPMIVAATEVLGLESRSIEYLDYHELVMAGKLPILHGHEVSGVSRAVNPARGLFLKAKSWAMCGHWHSTSEHTDNNIMGKLLTTWSIGCLCDLNPDYAPYGTNWNWGFAFVNVEKDGNFEVINRRILPNGNVV